MPIIIIFIAVILFAAAYQGNLSALGTELEQDVAGWFKWAVAVVSIGLLGKIPKFEKPAFMLLVLVLMVLIISNSKAFFTNIQNLAAVAPPTPPLNPAQANPAPAPGPGVELTGAAGAAAGGAGLLSGVSGLTGQATTTGSNTAGSSAPIPSPAAAGSILDAFGSGF